MRQIFFITDERLTVMLWQGTKLITEYDFEDNEDSKTDLVQYLETSRHIPSSIIIDILEEEIILTTIPHVAAHERKFLVERTLTRMFRASEFSSAEIIGREKFKRKDDRLLVSGLTTDKPLLKWLDILNENEVIIKGIHSLPLITANILKVLKLNVGLTLLVSRQSKSFIRQSIFKDGKLFYSRNIPSAQHFNIEIVSSDLQKTRKYLENQRLLAANDSINVVILTSQQFFDDLKGLDELVPDMDISYVKYEMLKESLGIESQFTVGGREIFSSLLLASKPVNHYGRKVDIERYSKKKLDKWISVASVVTTLLFMLMSAKFYIDIDILDAKSAGLEDQVLNLRQQNDKMSQEMDRLPVKARKMKLFVDNVSDIKLAASTGVDDSMIKISQVFNSYSNISLNKMNWYLSELDYNNKNKKQSSGRFSGKRPLLNATKSNDTQIIEIAANIDFSDSDKQQSMRALDKFISSIRDIEFVKSVVVTQQPIKASSKDNMSGVIAEKKRDISGFAFTIKMDTKAHAS